MLVIRGAYIRGGLYSGGGLHLGFYGICRMASTNYVGKLTNPDFVKGIVFKNRMKISTLGVS